MTEKSQTVFISGTGKMDPPSIGSGIIKSFAERGYNIAGMDIDPEAIEQEEDWLEENDISHLLEVGDLTEGEDVEKSVSNIIDKFGSIDVIVNVAGTASPSAPNKSWKIEEEELDTVYKVNIKTMWNVCRKIIPHMIEREQGRIINISSRAGKAPAMGLIPYSAMKAAINAFTQGMADELGEYGITVNAIGPGNVPTGGASNKILKEKAEEEGVPVDEIIDKYVSEQPLPIPQTPEQIGEMAAYLASEPAKVITGQYIGVCGGLSPLL